MAIDNYRGNPVGDPVVSTLLTYVVWFFLGVFGGHRFITGRVFTGLLMLLLHGLGWLTIWLFGIGLVFWIPLGIWWLLDALLIPGWVRNGR